MKFHGVYKPPKPKPKKQKPGKSKRKKPLIARKAAKVRPAREATAIKKTKAIKNDLLNNFIFYSTVY